MLQYGFDKSASLDEIIVRSSHDDITRRGLLSLLPDASLDDEIICMMSDYLTRRESCKSHGQPISWFLPTRYAQFATMPNAHLDGFKAASQYRKHYMYDLHRCHQIFVPMHDGGHHWFMVLVKIKDKQAEIWDPLPDARRTRDREIQVNSILHSLDAILHGVVDATYSVAWSFLSFVVTYGEGVPRQPNGFDCGVYVIKFMDTPGIITNKSYVYDSQNVRAQLALQLIDSPFNEQRDQLLALANAHYSNTTTLINESKLASTVKSRNVSTRKGHKNSCTKRRFRQKG